MNIAGRWHSLFYPLMWLMECRECFDICDYTLLYKVYYHPDTVVDDWRLYILHTLTRDSFSGVQM